MGADPEPPSTARERLRPLSRIELLVLVFLACRLLAWNFLLRPWGGFDEYAHHGYVEACAEDLRWHGFESVYVPSRLVAAEHEWRTGEKIPESAIAPAAEPGRRGNYETQQSPGYYVGAGLLLRILPPLSPVAELYLLRTINAALAFLVAAATLAAARRTGFSKRAWLPVAVLAFVPGFAIALVRVSNDALCALCLAIGVGASLEGPSGERRPILAAGAAGVAPWAKLYGLAGMPGVLIASLRRGEKKRAVSVVLLVLPAAALAFFSRRIHGSAIALADVLTHPAAVPVRKIPWVRDAWAFAKSHLWVSGMTVRVFPSIVYAVLGAGLALCAWKTAAVRLTEPRDRRNRIFVAIPVVVFLAAVVYFAPKNFAAYRSAGGVGGWYLWAMALPEALLITFGLARQDGKIRWFLVLLSGFLLLTIAGDFALFAEPGGLLATANGHIAGISGSFASIAEAFRRSRPAPAAIAAMVTAPLSWVLGALALAATFRSDA